MVPTQKSSNLIIFVDCSERQMKDVAKTLLADLAIVVFIF